MRVYKCDRCGQIINKTDVLARIDIGEINQETGSSGEDLMPGEQELDFCQTCVEEILAVIFAVDKKESASTTDKPKAAKSSKKKSDSPKSVALQLDEAVVRKMYVEERRSVKVIADYYGVLPGSVYRFIHKNGIVRKPGADDYSGESL